MKRIRVIPVLLLRKGGVVKTVKFKDPKYVGDCINAIKIFNEKEVDEMVVLDIDASPKNTPPNYQLIHELAGECFMPLSYGGGITSVEQAKRIIDSGIEKVILNTAAINNPKLVEDLAHNYGSSSVVVSLDIKKDWLGKYKVFTNGGKQKVSTKPLELALQMQNAGAGEIILNSIDRDGTFQGYDVPLTQSIANQLEIPVVACGGASKVEDYLDVIKNGNASAVAAGSMFVFKGVHRAVLINYPDQATLKEKIYIHL